MTRITAIALFFSTCAATATPEEKREATTKDREKIDALLLGAVKAEKIPGAVLWLERDGKFYQQAYGNRALAPARETMETDAVFDAASLTKVVATAPSILLLVERGKLKLDDLVNKHIPEFC